jgi:hypothetical protein
MKSCLLTGIICLALLSCKTYAQTNSSNSQTEIKKIPNMKEFILLVRVPVTYSSEQAKAVNPKWEIVLNKWKTDDVFVTSFVFPGESYTLSGADRLVKKEAVVSDNLKIVSNIILRATSLENAVELAKACPVVEHGGTVEVREIIPGPVKPTQNL